MDTKTKRIYDQVFQHPMTHNLEWNDIRTLFEDMGEVEQNHNGNIKLTISGHAAMFQSPNDSDVATPEQVMQIRHLIQDSQVSGEKESGQNILVVIDHKEAKIYRTEMKGTVPELVTPNDPDGHDRHVHSAHNYRDQNGTLNHDAYFSDVAKRLAGAEKIVVFGSGTGSSSTMDLFASWLKEHRKDVSEKVMGLVIIDQGHMTESQLLARARDFYAVN